MIRFVPFGRRKLSPEQLDDAYNERRLAAAGIAILREREKWAGRFRLLLDEWRTDPARAHLVSELETIVAELSNPNAKRRS